jgi:hypothetical protein
MTNDPDYDHDRDHANDNDSNRHKPEGAVAPAPTAGALASLSALGTALNRVDIAFIIGRSGRPMLQFKAREGDGVWSYGQRRTINPLTFEYGYISFGDNNKMLDERLVSVSQPKPDPTTLPDTGFEWSEEWAVGMKCLSGADAGVEVVFKTTTDGGKQAVAGLIAAVRDRLNSGQHGDKISPIVRLERDSYPHGQYGRTNTPQMPIVGWMSLRGPAPAPAPASPPPAEQPRRRPRAA